MRHSNQWYAELAAHLGHPGYSTLAEIRRAEAEEAARRCLVCGADLANITGVHVFVKLQPRPGLLCIEHGANGANNLTAEEYGRLTAAANEPEQ